VSTDGVVTVHLAIDTSALPASVARSVGIDQNKVSADTTLIAISHTRAQALVVKMQWREPTPYMGQCPSASKHTLEVRQTSADVSKLENAEKLNDWQQVESETVMRRVCVCVTVYCCVVWTVVDVGAATQRALAAALAAVFSYVSLVCVCV
jgi:hypothetical protein